MCASALSFLDGKTFAILKPCIVIMIYRKMTREREREKNWALGCRFLFLIQQLSSIVEYRVGKTKEVCHVPPLNVAVFLTGRQWPSCLMLSDDVVLDCLPWPGCMATRAADRGRGRQSWCTLFEIKISLSLAETIISLCVFVFFFLVF